MASRSEYTDCMVPFMSGKGKTKDERQMDMCVGAKVCSKGVSLKEAEQICANLPPKEPKPRKSISRRGVDPGKLASCVAGTLEIKGLTADNLTPRLEAAITHCSMTKSASPPTYKRFMNACLKETGGGGDFLKAQGDIKKCQAKWNESQGA